MSSSCIMGNLMTMFAAGSEMTANMAMICFWEFLQEENREILEELTDEVFALPTNLETASLDDLMEGLPLVRAFFYEINRLKGTAPGLVFESKQDLVIAGMEGPMGTTFYINSAYLGTLKDGGIPDGPNGESPGVFCPNCKRWLHSQTDGSFSVVKPSPKTGEDVNSGFGNGVRICPGQHLAEVEFVYCIAKVLKHFEISLPPDHYPVKMITIFTDVPDSDIQIIFRRR